MALHAILTEHLLPFLNREINIGSPLLRLGAVHTHSLTVYGTATVPTPSASTDATTKSYVDGLLTGILSLQLEEVDGAPVVTDARTLRFDGADGFVLTDLGGQVARLDLAQDIRATASPTFAGLTLSSALTVANGGTGLASGTSGGVPYYSAATTLASSGALTAKAVVLGGGAGASPTALTDPGADRLVFWDESVNTTAYLTLGSGLTITDTTIAADASGANPSATIGLSAVNGSAATFLRSDGAPALGVGIAPTWTAAHVFSLSGLAVRLSGATALIGAGTTDPGWGTSGAVGYLAGRAFVGGTSATSGLHVGYNFYNDGGGFRYIVTDTSERLQMGQGNIIVKMAASGTAGNAITYTDHTTFTQGGGIVIGAPTGGDQGLGTLNCKAAYDDGVILTDHVFDQEYDGRIAPHVDPEIDRWQKRFDPAWLDPVTYHARMKALRRLPEMPTARNQKSLGELVNAIVLNLECQAVHQEKLLKRLAVLEARP